MAKPITCLLIDDEPLARKILGRFVSRVPLLQLIGSFSNVVEAMPTLYTKPDLLFLDIQMPELTGFHLLDILQHNRPAIILTTAYPEYAIHGFDYDVADYLLKPIPFDRFLRAVNKGVSQLQSSTKFIPEKTAINPLSTRATDVVSNNSNDPYIWIIVNRTKLHLNTEEILFIESIKDHVKLHLESYCHTVRIPLYKIEDLLPPNQFVRINRSYLVRRDAIILATGSIVELRNKKQLPIGICYRESVRERLR